MASLAACGFETASSVDDSPAPADPNTPTWSAAVRDVVARNCITCHLPGGIGPFPLDTYEAASSVATAALAAIELGRMPPWMPSEDCRSYLDERRISPADVDVFRAWVEGGTPEGESTEPLEAPSDAVLPTADIVAAPTGPFTPNPAPGNLDDYRCFLLDHVFEEDTFLEEGWVQPGAEALVHHVLLYTIGQADAADAAAQEGADGQAGFPCFGAMTGGPVGWWVPGAVPQRYSGPAAKVFTAGTRLLMQVHYNVIGADPTPDLTTYHIVTRPAPEQAAVTVGLGNRNIEILPDDPDSVHVRDFRNTGTTDWVLSEVMGHMHLLGTRMRLEAVRANGEIECLLDIPEWDFDWQQMYRLPEDEKLTVAPGEALRLTCAYDNTLANQPVVDGERPSPGIVRWGEGSLDEMCLAYVTREVPLADNTPVPDVCEGLDACRASCAASDDYLCLLGCSFRRPTCGDCLIREMFQGGCGSQACGTEAQAIASCFSQCRRSAPDALEACLAERCPTETTALNVCLTPVVAADGCEGALTVCGG